MQCCYLTFTSCSLAFLNNMTCSLYYTALAKIDNRPYLLHLCNRQLHLPCSVLNSVQGPPLCSIFKFEAWDSACRGACKRTVSDDSVFVYISSIVLFDSVKFHIRLPDLSLSGAWFTLYFCIGESGFWTVA